MSALSCILVFPPLQGVVPPTPVSGLVDFRFAGGALDHWIDAQARTAANRDWNERDRARRRLYSTF